MVDLKPLKLGKEEEVLEGVLGKISLERLERILKRLRDHFEQEISAHE